MVRLRRNLNFLEVAIIIEDVQDGGGTSSTEEDQRIPTENPNKKLRVFIN